MSVINSISKTYDPTYNRPLRYRIEIWDAPEDELLYYSDGFNPQTSTITVENININQAEWETWDASIAIDDSVYNNLDPDLFDNGAVLKIGFGKTLPTLENAFYGIIDLLGPSRYKEKKLQYTASAKGFGVVPTYTYVDFQKVPPPDTLKPGAHVSNIEAVPFFAHNLFESVWKDINIMPLLDYTLEQRMGKNFSLEGISDAVKDFIPGIRNPLVTAAQVYTLIARMSGSVWFIDQNKTAQLRYPYGDNSGIIIKDYYEETDTGDYTAYVRKDTTFSYLDSTRTTDGFANQLFAIAEKIDIIGEQAKAISFMSLYDKDVCFAKYPGPHKFKNMTFIMSKVGPGSNAPNPATAKIYGYIREDNNGAPTGEVVAHFSINVSDIADTPSPVYKINRPDFDNINISKLHWITLQEIGSGENNTCRLWNDDDRTIVSTTERPRLIATRSLKGRGRSDGDPFSKKGWVVSNTGPEVSIAFATTQNIVVEASDDLSIQKWSKGRPVQARITQPSLKSVQATQTYMRLLVGMTAQKIRNYGNLEVSIPNILIQPSTEVQVASDLMPDLHYLKNRVATVKRVNYNLDTKDFAVGTKYCTVELKGYVSPI